MSGGGGGGDSGGGGDGGAVGEADVAVGEVAVVGLRKLTCRSIDSV